MTPLTRSAGAPGSRPAWAAAGPSLLDLPDDVLERILSLMQQTERCAGALGCGTADARRRSHAPALHHCTCVFTFMPALDLTLGD